MIKVDMFDRNGDVMCTLSLKSVKGEIEYEGKRAEFVKRMLEEEEYRFTLEDENKLISVKKDPLEFISYAFKVFSGSAMRASMPEFIED